MFHADEAVLAEAKSKGETENDYLYPSVEMCHDNLSSL